METKQVFGSELKVGDVLTALWHAPQNKDRIIRLEPYTGPLAYLFPKGAQSASFAVAGGMTIDNADIYKVLK